MVFSNYSGILVPGGFGQRGIEGKVLAAKWARENKKPYLGKIKATIMENIKDTWWV